MGWLFSLLFAYCALALQATFAPYVEIGGIRPDLPIMATVIIAATRGPIAGIVCGFLIGLGQDLGNPAFLGLNALCKSLLGFLVGGLRERFDTFNTATHAAILLLATVAHDLVYLTIFTRLALSELSLELITRSIPAGVYTAAIGMWLFTFFAARFGKRGPRFARSRLASR